MSSVSQYFKGLFGGIGALLTGMSVTIKELFSKKITQQYPENRKTLVISDRFRGELVMPHDENNEHACTSCGICEMNCPNGTIKITSKMLVSEDGKKKKILDTYFYNLGMCTFCNLCVITCPSSAIKFENTFENAIFTRAKLNMRLNKEGSKLREKKKPEPKVAAEKPAAPKADETKTIVNEATQTKPEPELTHAPDSQVDSNPAAGKPIQSELEKQPIKPEATKSPEAKAKADVEAAEKKAETKTDPVIAPIIVEKGTEETQEKLNQEKPEAESKPAQQEEKPQEKEPLSEADNAETSAENEKPAAESKPKVDENKRRYI